MFFTKENILNNTKILLVLLIFHFILTTFVRFQLWKDMWITFLNSDIINLWKDIYLILIYFLIIWYYFKNKIYIDKKLFIWFIILFIVSLLISFIHFHSLKNLIIWIKYDFWFLIPLLAFSTLSINEKDIKKIYNLLINLIKLVIILSFIFSIIILNYPYILFLLWYWPLWDWSVWNNPPIFYNTWINGIKRFSGIFSWPNNMAFYLISFLPVILLSILYKKLNIIWWIFSLILLFWTLSRSWIIAFFVEFFLISLFLLFYYKTYKKIVYLIYILGGIWITILWIYLYINWIYHEIILRWASTAWHIEKFSQTLSYIIKNPILWYWLWTAWPVAHYTKNNIIPESWFLQIFYELWIIWGVMWFIFLMYSIYILYKSRKIVYNNMDKISILQVWLSIWVIWLLVQWVFLHSFEDSMVSLPLFIIIWLLLWYKFQIWYKK